MNASILSNVTYLLRGLIFSPRIAFAQIKEGAPTKEGIKIIFLITMLITFIRSFFARWNKAFNFFDKQSLNATVIFLNHPLVMWVREYLLYFLAVFLIAKLCRIFSKKQCERLPYMLMSVSGIGLIGQAFFLPAHYLLSHDFLKIISLLFPLWNLILIFFAVQIASSLSYAKTLITVIIPLILFAVSPFGIWSFMSPYFLFIN